MGWFELSIKIYDQCLEESVNAFLFDLGVSGTFTEEKENSLIVKGYIPEDLFFKNLDKVIEKFLKDLLIIFPETPRKPEFYIKKVEHGNWINSWKDHFKPIYVSKNLIVSPSWKSVRSKNRHIIKIDPGPAFGTGTHPTTQLCLRAMERLSYQLNSPWNVLDVGTGTGILAIYGAMLGAKNVLAIDIDPIALKWAEHNIRLNHVADKIILASESIRNISKRFYLITMNLLFDEIKEIISYIPCILKEWLIISGILKEQYLELKDILQEYNITVKDLFYKEDWTCIISSKR